MCKQERLFNEFKEVGLRVGALSGIVQNRSYRPTEEELDEFTELVNMNINKILKLKEDTMRFFLDETR